MQAADPLYRAAYRAGFRVALAYWRLRRPPHHGALVAVWAKGRLLFVRQSYRRALSFPGGGVHPGEQPVEAARRELAEELGLHVRAAALEPVFEITGLFDGRRDTVSFFDLHLPAEPLVRPDNREIVQAIFVDRTAFRTLHTAPPVARYLARLPSAPRA